MPATTNVFENIVYVDMKPLTFTHVRENVVLLTLKRSNILYSEEKMQTLVNIKRMTYISMSWVAETYRLMGFI